jgi:hypothetical protein
MKKVHRVEDLMARLAIGVVIGTVLTMTLVFASSTFWFSSMCAAGGCN